MLIKLDDKSAFAEMEASDNIMENVRHHVMTKEAFESVNASEYAAIVLAAGSSERMGDNNKLLLEINGQSLLRHCVNTVVKSGVIEAVVVLGHDRANTEREIIDSAVKSVFNPHYKAGLQSSVLCGLNALSGNSKAAFICLSDQPTLTARHLRQLMWAFNSRPDGAEFVVPMFGNERGNPIIVSENARNKIVRRKSGQSLSVRAYIDAHPEQVCWVSFNDPAYTEDIDTPSEYSLLCDAQEQGINKPDQ